MDVGPPSRVLKREVVAGLSRTGEAGGSFEALEGLLAME
jgi:hypothetical protein